MITDTLDTPQTDLSVDPPTEFVSLVDLTKKKTKRGKENDKVTQLRRIAEIFDTHQHMPISKREVEINLITRQVIYRDKYEHSSISFLDMVYISKKKIKRTKIKKTKIKRPRKHKNKTMIAIMLSIHSFLFPKQIVKPLFAQLCGIYSKPMLIATVLFIQRVGSVNYVWQVQIVWLSITGGLILYIILMTLE